MMCSAAGVNVDANACEDGVVESLGVAVSQLVNRSTGRWTITLIGGKPRSLIAFLYEAEHGSAG